MCSFIDKWCQICSELHFRLKYPDSTLGMARGRNEPLVLDLMILVGPFQPQIFCESVFLALGSSWAGLVLVPLDQEVSVGSPPVSPLPHGGDSPPAAIPTSWATKGTAVTGAEGKSAGGTKMASAMSHLQGEENKSGILQIPAGTIAEPWRAGG